MTTAEIAVLEATAEYHLDQARHSLEQAQKAYDARLATSTQARKPPRTPETASATPGT